MSSVHSPIGESGPSIGESRRVAFTRWIVECVGDVPVLKSASAARHEQVRMASAAGIRGR